jgi:hypothetical protein
MVRPAMKVLEVQSSLHGYLEECRSAAQRDNNQSILETIDQVPSTFDLWERCILARPAIRVVK